MKQWKHLSLFGLIAALGLLAVFSSTPTASADPILDELIITDFSGGDFENTNSDSDGLTLTASAFSGSYVSPILEAPIDFNVVVPEWTAVTSATTDIHFLVRTGSPDGTWQAWTAVHAHADWNEPGDPVSHGEMILVPEADTTHTRIQFAVNFSRDTTLVAPILNDITFVFIDSTAGPTSQQMAAQQARLDAASPESTAETTLTNPRPTVISRDVWCTSADCDYTAGLTYRPATHMVVHHTVSGNNGYTDWAPIVRAIWSYHTYTNGWGDIGYNYLIDQNGYIYEGHMNQDYVNLDVVGTHAAGANSGSMGVSLIGTFTDLDDYPTYNGITPPQVMVNSLIDLLSWKAEQRNINVFESSDALPYIDYGLPHLMGHRNVYGTTECPGDQAFRLIPGLRQQVATRIGITDPYFYVSEESAAFTKSVANWYLGDNECGHNGHAYQTWSTTDPADSANWGEWQLDVPEDGRYQLQAFVPFCRTGRDETAGAPYTVTHNEGTDTVIISQQANLGLWATIGEFEMLTAGNNSLFLNDLVTTDNLLGLWFDDIRLLKVGEVGVPPVTLSATSPAANTWHAQPDVIFNWSITGEESVKATQLTAATDITMTNTVFTQTWASAVLSHTHTFAADDADLYWQVSVEITPTAGITQTTLTTAPIHFGVDTTPPSSTITHIVREDGDYHLYWQGSDATSGVIGYDVYYRPQGSLDWTGWETGTLALDGRFTPPQPATVYEFRVQATDAAGNVELDTAAETDTLAAVAITLQTPASAAWLNQRDVAFSWATANPGTVQTTTLRLLDGNTELHTQSWPGVITQTNYTFAADAAALSWEVTAVVSDTSIVSDTIAATSSGTFGIDSVAPASVLTGLFHIDGRYLLLWSGSDTLSGIAGYNLEYQLDGSPDWTRWATGTIGSSAYFTPPDTNATYNLRVQAVDVAGNEEPAKTTPDAATTDAIDLTYSTMLPIITRN